MNNIVNILMKRVVELKTVKHTFETEEQFVGYLCSNTFAYINEFSPNATKKKPSLTPAYELFADDIRGLPAIVDDNAATKHKKPSTRTDGKSSPSSLHSQDSYKDSNGNKKSQHSSGTSDSGIINDNVGNKGKAKKKKPVGCVIA